MPTYKAPVEDTLFLLYDVLKLENFGNLPGFADAPRDVVEAVLNEGAKLCEEVIQPLNVVGDTVGCKRNDERCAENLVTHEKPLGKAVGKLKPR